MNPMISIIDDDASVRQATDGLVRSLGYSTATFASAEEFLDSARVAETSCVVTDIQMPGLSGIDLKDRLAADGHRVPMVFMTAFPDERIRARVMAAGAVGFLAKPFEDESLIACLAQAIAP